MQLGNLKKIFTVKRIAYAALIIGIGVGAWIAYQNISRYLEDKKFGETLAVRPVSEMPADLPADSFYDYDVRQYKAMFTIQSIDIKNSTMQLQFVYPFKWQGNTISANVACDKAHTALYMNKLGFLASSTTAWQEEKRITAGGVMQAICADQYCRTITQYCEFIID